jgi:hypothetical protein
MSEQFQDPTQPGMFKAEDWTNHLLLVEPHRYIDSIVTKFGPSDAIEARITVLSAQPPHVIEQARLWGTRLVSTLRPALGGLPVLGRLTQELTSGGNAMWVLSESSPEDKAFAHSYLASRPATQTPTQPQPQAVPQVPQVPQVPVTHVIPQAPNTTPYMVPQGAPAQPEYAIPQPAIPQVLQTPAGYPTAQPQPVPQPVPMPVPSPAVPAAPAGALTAEQIAAMPPEVRAMIVGQQGTSS